MDTVTQNPAQSFLFCEDELPILEVPKPRETPVASPKKSRTRVAKPKPTAQQIAEREAIERAALARRKKFRARKAWETNRPLVGPRIRNRFDPYD